MTDAWVDACSIDDVEEEDVMGVKIGDTSVAVYNVEGEFFASSDICTHGQACLSEGIVIGDLLDRVDAPAAVTDGAAHGSPVVVVSSAAAAATASRIFV